MLFPEEGDVFSGVISRISGSGNGLIEIGDRFINIGPISENQVGSEVRGLVESVEGNQAIAFCLTEEIQTHSTLRWIESQVMSSPVGEVVAEVDRISHSGVPIVEHPGFSEQILVTGDTNHVESGQTVLIRVHHSDDQILGDLVTVKKNTEKWESDLWNRLDDHLNLSEIDKTVNIDLTSQDPSPTTDRSTSSDDLDQLRKQAEGSSIDEVPDGVTTTTQQYSRSQKVKEYVKARSDGSCEGCNEPAPFTSKTGEPYLHAHHVYELSEGGSDTVDTVIALCPNCHYRVHHGEDGDTYNEELVERLRDIEST